MQSCSHGAGVSEGAPGSPSGPESEAPGLCEPPAGVARSSLPVKRQSGHRQHVKE